VGNHHSYVWVFFTSSPVPAQSRPCQLNVIIFQETTECPPHASSGPAQAHVNPWHAQIATITPALIVNNGLHPVCGDIISVCISLNVNQ